LQAWRRPNEHRTGGSGCGRRTTWSRSQPLRVSDLNLQVAEPGLTEC